MRKNNILLYLFLILVFLLSPESVFSGSPSYINEIPLQYTPTAIAVNHSDNTAFAVSENYKTLYKVDLKSLTVISFYILQDKPRDVALNGDRVYVPAGKDAKGALYVFDKNLNPISTVDIGKSPSSVAVGNGIVAVGCENNNTVYVINEASLQISYSMNIGMKPNHVEIDKKRNEIIVSAAMASNSGTGASEGGTVLFLDLPTGSIKRSINTVQKVKDLKLNTVTDRIILTNAVNGIYIINPDTMTIEQHIELPNAGAEDINQSTGTAVVLSPMTANVLAGNLEPHQLIKGLYDVAINPYTNQAAIAADNSIILLQLPNPRPEITNLVPRSARSGEAVFSLLVEGKKFITTSSVQFNQNNLTTAFKDNEELEAQVPSTLLSSPGTAPVTVTNPAPDGGVSEPYPFTIKYPIPVLQSISPDTIAARSPDFTLKVNGSNFYPGYVVNFNGQNLITTYINQTEVNATIPSSLVQAKGIYLVVVKTPDGQNSNFLNFTVTDPYPVITDFTPKSGEAGTLVTIIGDNFNYTPTKVFFNGVQATIISPSSIPLPRGEGTEGRVISSVGGELKAIVPIGASTGPITVTTLIGSAQSTEPFTVLLRQDFALNISPQSVSIPLNGNAGAIVSLQSTGLEQFTGLVKLSVDSASSITGVFNPENISLNQSSILNLKILTALTSTLTLTIAGTANIEGTEITRTVSLTLNPIPQGATTITGRIVRSKDSQPIKGVTLTIGDKTAVTDQAGNFLFIDAPVGEQTLMIDGGTANTPNATYPSRIPVPVTIIGGIDNKLPYFIYLHEVNTKTFTPINPAIDTIVTDPEIPHLEMRIPAGVQIIGWDGLPNEKVSVTPIAVDRLPIRPLPDGVYASEVYMYYFGKPGGGTPTQPIPVKMPNTLQANLGDRIKLWYYDESPTPDPNSNQWKVFGMGTVSDDGRNIIPDPGVGIPKFCCGASFPSPAVPATSPQPSPADAPCNLKAEPVDTYNGMFVYKQTDIGYPSPSLINITRLYNSGNTTIGSFGLGTSTDYNYYLQGSGSALTYITPAGGRYILSQNADGGYTNDMYPFLRGAKAYLNGDGTRTLKFKDGKTYTFDSNGRLIEQRDSNGNWVQIARDSLGNITGLTNSFGRNLYITNTGVQIGNIVYTLISSITDVIGREVTYTYDSSARLTSVTMPDGSKTIYSYDGAGRIISIKNPRGIVEVANQYDSYGRISKQTHADGGEYLFYYFAPSTPVRVVDPSSPVTSSCTPQFVREGEQAGANTCGIIYLNVPTSQSVPQGSTATSAITQTVVINPNKSSETLRFNGQGYTREEVDGTGGKIVYERETSTNRLLSATDQLGRKTSYAYDTNGNIAFVTDPAGNVTSYEYDLTFNKPTKITDALGNVTAMTYDAKGNLISLTDPMGKTTTIVYNSNGQPLSVTNALGNITTFEYDEYGNLIKTADPLGNSAKMEYDYIGRLIAATDPKGKSTLYSYDLMNRIKEITDAMNEKTKFTYDKNGNLLSVTDAKNQVITYTYNNRDKVASMTDQIGKVETYTYDKMDNLVSMKDRKSQVTSYAHNILNQLTKTTYADGNSTSYFYDAIGRLTTVTDTDTGTIQYVYSNTGCALGCGSGAVDKVIQEITALGSVNYAYDAIGRRINMTVAGQPTVNYQYNANSRLIQIAQGTQTVAINHDSIGRRTTMTLPNGIVATYNYDNANRLTNITYSSDSLILKSLNYAHDKNNNRTSFSGHKTLMPEPKTAVYNQANQQIQVDNETLIYDENGNLIQKGDATYTWNARNQLVSIASPTYNATFKYDPFGRRTEKTINGMTISYLYDGWDIMQEIEDGMVTTNYLRGLHIDETLGIFRQEGTYYYIHDALGSTIALTDPLKNIVTEYFYDPFGNTQTSNPSIYNPFQYTGRENDGNGIYHYRLRTKLGERFASEDPIRLRGGINFFAYVNNQPTRYRDPFGLFGPATPAVVACFSNPACSGAVLAGGAAVATAIGNALKDSSTGTLVPSGSDMPAPDLTGSPESCSLIFQSCMAICDKGCQSTGSKAWCKTKCWIGYLYCMAGNL